MNEYAVLSEDLAAMKIRLCSTESQLATAQQDLKDVVSGDLQLASALKEVRHLRSRLEILQTEKLQAAAQVRFTKPQNLHKYCTIFDHGPDIESSSIS